MRSKVFALAAASVAALLVWSTFDTAEARRGGGFRGGGGHFHGGGFRGGPRFHGGGFRNYGFARRGLYFAAPFAAYGGYRYYNGYYGGGGCEWLRRRAANTGSRYWWNRYYGCINGY